MAILLTGSTGYLGSHLAASLLLRTSEKLVLPIRAHHSQEDLMNYIKASVELENEDFTPEKKSRLKILELPPPGKLENLIPTLKESGVDEILHAAGSLNYFSKKKLHAGNIQYTQDLLQLGKKLGIKIFSYISTAFSSGYRNGLISEQLHDEPESDPTYYTLTKRRAEHLVHEGELPYLIIRPSVVIGDSRDGHYQGKSYGIYQLMSLFERLLTGKYVSVFNTVAPPLPLHVIHQDAFCNGVLAARKHLSPGSIINLVSREETLSTVREFNDICMEIFIHPEKVNYYPEGNAVPQE
ncbi:MAG: SDR family oxidoreductase, partial [bacterium]|nr:SDR family oxidoreductase [bacterium]